MRKYAKIIDEKTLEVQVGAGCEDSYYISIGMALMDVEQAYNLKWYIEGYAPDAPTPPAPTKEDIRLLRVAYRQTHIDDKTIERARRIANSTWEENDEAAYLELDAEVTKYIEENLPYPVE